jgi:glycosyltransferase involved in cell wall biosynthesis
MNVGLTPSAAPRLSVVVPCYNEFENIDELYRRLSPICTDVAGDRHEIVLVNDGSRDATWTKIGQLCLTDRHVVGVNLARNYGHQLALTAGLSMCSGERILIIDADLQDPPELLVAMMARMDEGCDVLYGQRRSRSGETWFKKTTASLFYRLLGTLIDIEVPRDTGDFRLMNRRALDVLMSMPEQHRFIRGMVSWVGLRQEPILYDRAERFAGETKYPFSKMLRFAFDAITGFSIQPLRVASYLGIALGVCSLFLLAYVLGSWISGYTVDGWTSLMVVVVTLSSAQLFVLGIMGEYLGRLYMEAKRRPLFVVDQVVNGRSETPQVVHPPQALTAMVAMKPSSHAA